MVARESERCRLFGVVGRKEQYFHTSDSSSIPISLCRYVRQGRYIPDLYDLARVAVWEPYIMRGLRRVFSELDLYCTDPAQYIIRAGSRIYTIQIMSICALGEYVGLARRKWSMAEQIPLTNPLGTMYSDLKQALEVSW